jgi:N-acyl-D-aspartate/D-glutamate deacylase
MEFDLLIKNGRVVDGSGGPSFEGDVGIKGGRIVEVGKLSSSALQVIDVQGQVIAPGFIDNHCHFDGQVLWDPLCTFSCYHGATTVINGNCSLALAPARPDARADLISMLSRVEAIPVESLQAGVDFAWESYPQYLDRVDGKLGVNVGSLMGFSAIRRHVMGEAAYIGEASPAQIEEMKELVREGLRAGSIGLSSELNKRHMDHEGRVLPANHGAGAEFYEVAMALGEVGAGTIQFGDSGGIEKSDGLLSRIARDSGRPVVTSRLKPDGVSWDGLRMYSMQAPFLENTARWTLISVGTFDGMPGWAKIIALPVDEKRVALADPAVRAMMREEAAKPSPYSPESGSAVDWSKFYVASVALDKNQPFVERSVTEMAAMQGKDPMDAFLDLGLEEDFKTLFYQRTGVTAEAVGNILTDPSVLPGLSDGGAHVTRRCDSHFSTFLLSFWVRQRQAMSLEAAVRKLTFMGASIFGLHDRGLIRPGLAGDIVVFDPDTVAPGNLEEVTDYPADATRMRRMCEGVNYTIVNGEVLIDHGQHTGALPGRLLRGSAYQI